MSRWAWSSKDFIEHSNIIGDVYEIIEEYNLDKKHKVLTVFNVVIADKIINKKLTQIVTELFIRKRKLNISTVFSIQSYFALTKMFEYTVYIALSWKFQINENFSNLHLIIYQIWTLMTFWIYRKMYCKSIFFFSEWYYPCTR